MPITERLITERYFTHPKTYIPAINTVDNTTGAPTGAANRLTNEIRDYIALYEPRFLLDLLGRELAEKVETSPEQYTELVKDLRDEDHGFSVIAMFVYFHFMRDGATTSTPTGEVRRRNDASKIVSPAARLVRTWNDMAQISRKIAIKYEDIACPNWESSIFYDINILGI